MTPWLGSGHKVLILLILNLILNAVPPLNAAPPPASAQSDSPQFSSIAEACRSRDPIQPASTRELVDIVCQTRQNFAENPTVVSNADQILAVLPKVPESHEWANDPKLTTLVRQLEDSLTHQVAASMQRRRSAPPRKQPDPSKPPSLDEDLEKYLSNWAKPEDRLENPVRYARETIHLLARTGVGARALLAFREEAMKSPLFSRAEIVIGDIQVPNANGIWAAVDDPDNPGKFVSRITLDPTLSPLQFLLSLAHELTHGGRCHEHGMHKAQIKDATERSQAATSKPQKLRTKSHLYDAIRLERMDRFVDEVRAKSTEIDLFQELANRHPDLICKISDWSEQGSINTMGAVMATFERLRDQGDFPDLVASSYITAGSFNEDDLFIDLRSQPHGARTKVSGRSILQKSVIERVERAGFKVRSEVPRGK